MLKRSVPFVPQSFEDDPKTEEAPRDAGERVNYAYCLGLLRESGTQKARKSKESRKVAQRILPAHNQELECKE